MFDIDPPQKPLIWMVLLIAFLAGCLVGGTVIQILYLVL